MPSSDINVTTTFVSCMPLGSVTVALPSLSTTIVASSMPSAGVAVSVTVTW